VIYTPTGIDVSELPIDPVFVHGQDVTITVTAYFEPDPGGSGTDLQSIVTQHVLAVVPCFTPGTLIQTSNGAVLIEDLEIGDRVVTRDHGMQPIRWIGATALPKGYAAANKRLRPILIRKDALGPNQPDRDMRVSRQHRILVRDWRADMLFGKPGGALVPAFSLCNDSTIIEDRAPEEVTYIHMVFEQHEIVYADGVEAESFHPGARTVFGLSTPQKSELLELFPQLAGEIDDFAYVAAREELRGGIAKILSDQS